jgi:hypothetical protein
VLHKSQTHYPSHAACSACLLRLPTDIAYTASKCHACTSDLPALSAKTLEVLEAEDDGAEVSSRLAGVWRCGRCGAGVGGWVGGWVGAPCY